MVNKAFQLAVLILLLAGCGGAVKQSWTDFRAYYNTFYNAREHFRTGLSKVERQPEQIDIARPLRVYLAPLPAGDQDFRNAIDKGARILRKFPDSQWLDPTIELIGKSYFYRREYYSALQKFEELYEVAGTDRMRRSAIFWKGRTLLELGRYAEGVRYLQESIEEWDREEDPGLLGKTEVLLAEHHLALEEYTAAERIIGQALPRLPVNERKARVYFLFGQVLQVERLFGEAAFAFEQVETARPSFELLFWARFKRGEVLREMGNADRALAIYRRMIRDDKNQARQPLLYYQIARTEEMLGNYQDAVRLYNRLLHQSTVQIPPQVQSDSYLRLGELYESQYRDYGLAAAYFDSATSYGERRDVAELAEAYGRYTSLRGEIARQDSLLRLGALPPAELDSVLGRIREQRIRELRNEQDREESARMLENRPAGEEGTAAGSSGMYGFLNHLNPSLLNRARADFRALWGERPLADHWRRIEAVRGVRPSRPIVGGDRGSDPAAAGVNELPGAGLVDRGEIPITPEERRRASDRIAEQRYALGNLFMLNLQLPDSAEANFRKVVERHPDHELVPRALYALHELSEAEGDARSAEEWAGRLRERFPESLYTRALSRRDEPGMAPNEEEGMAGLLNARAEGILNSGGNGATVADSLRSLARMNREHEASARIHFLAIQTLIGWAKAEDRQAADRPAEQPEPVANAASDTLATDSGASYRGSHWDRVRAWLSEHRQWYPDGAFVGRVETLQAELEGLADGRSGVSPVRQ